MQARINARKKYCANDIIPPYEGYYRKVLEPEPGTRFLVEILASKYPMTR